MEHRSSSALCACPYPLCQILSCSHCSRLPFLRMKLRESQRWFGSPWTTSQHQEAALPVPRLLFKALQSPLPLGDFIKCLLCKQCLGLPPLITSPQTPITFTFLLHFELVWHWLSSSLGLLLYSLHCSARYCVLPLFHISHLPSSLGC